MLDDLVSTNESDNDENRIFAYAKKAPLTPLLARIAEFLFY